MPRLLPLALPVPALASALLAAGVGKAEDTPPAGGAEAAGPVEAAEHAVVGLDLAAAPPVVVKTSPRAGDDAGVPGVPGVPGVRTISVTFSKPMRGGSWSWSAVTRDSFPPFEAADGRTCEVQVKLEPGHTHGIWLNSQKSGNVQDAGGQKAVPCLPVFRTAEAGSGRSVTSLGRPHLAGCFRGKARGPRNTGNPPRDGQQRHGSRAETPLGDAGAGRP